VTTYKKKLIEVAIPLEAINEASAREKSIRHGHPATLHLWWARRPLAACRAVLFAQLVDDPSGYADKLLDDPKIRERAEADLVVRLKTWRDRKADAQGNIADTPEPTLEDCAADIERKRLFMIIEDLVVWENSTNEEVLERARAEIRRSCGGELPPIYDPFSGGGSIPLEAQRLGLPAYGSDLNPVAVMIGKAMIEIPPKFKDMEPIHPGVKERQFYRNAEGLAEDVKYYGTWMREKAFERIGHLYPQVRLPRDKGGSWATVIAWIWARTVPSPDPAFSDVQVPLVSNFLLGTKPKKEAFVRPVVDKAAKTIRYEIVEGGSAGEREAAKDGTKSGRASFRCLISESAITPEYIKEMGAQGRIGQSLIAIVAEGSGRRNYLAPSRTDEDIAFGAKPEWAPENEISTDGRAFTTPAYGLKTFGDLFTARQLAALNAFSDLLFDVRKKASEDFSLISARNSGSAELSQDYGAAISLFLSFAINRMADLLNNLCQWRSDPGKEHVGHLFSRQAIPMVWDFAEANPFAGSAGSWEKCLSFVPKVIECLPPFSTGRVFQANAGEIVAGEQTYVISCDPPYYDNVGYADLADFFYPWLRRALKDVFPEIFGFLVTPKSEELVATASRHSSKSDAEAFFLSGMQKAMSRMYLLQKDEFPTSIYYAFKQSEIQNEGVSSTGWATFLQAVLDAGFSVVGTWPVRTELANRIRGIGANALANSVVLVCRKRLITANSVTRAEFIRALKRELPPAIAELQAANIAPADMPQSAIGPGMGAFSRYKTVLESDDSPMSVKTALQLINRELDEYLGGIQGEFDADTRFAITWFEQNGLKAGEYGTANSIATARGISVDSVKHAGIVESAAGKVRILSRDELDADWTPDRDDHLTVWECLQHLVRQHEKDGISPDTAVLLKRIGSMAEAVKDLAYCLYDISANKRKDAKEATAYNALIADWTELTRQAAGIHDVDGKQQMRLDI
jgi:putative DNA methylase